MEITKVLIKRGYFIKAVSYFEADSFFHPPNEPFKLQFKNMMMYLIYVINLSISTKKSTSAMTHNLYFLCGS